MTRKELATTLDVTDRTVVRKIEKVMESATLRASLKLSNGQKFPPNDDLPELLVTYLLNGKPSQIEEKAGQNGKSSEIPGPECEGIPISDIFKLNEDREFIIGPDDIPSNIVIKDDIIYDNTPKSSGQGVGKTLSDRLIHGDMMSVIMTLVLVMADSYSCGWIAYEKFDGHVMAVVFFSLIGFAFAFASIRNAVKMPTKSEGYVSKSESYKQARQIANRWLIGLGLAQVLLHASAFKLFTSESYDDISLAVGSWVVCILIASGTIGIAITFRKTKLS